MHVRESIRSAIVTALSGNTNAGTNVFSFRIISHQDTILPSINVNILTESSELHNQARDLQRSLDVVIEARVKSTSYESDAEDLAEGIEIAIATDPTFGGLAKRTELVATTFEESAAGNIPMVLVSLNYNVRYYTTSLDPTTAL